MADMEIDEVDQEEVPFVDGVPAYPDIVVPPRAEAIQSFDGSGPRLLITKIVNENFKSYAKIQELGPFHKSFSSIVGPNGSGKSNVIDSMLFVFGYRANKIRSKKVSVLIHNSDKHPDVTSCSVTVHFQKITDTGPGDDDYNVVPNSQFKVSRTAFKDNSSYYKIDDRKATYKEVAALLRTSGIDLDHNRFLILQGEVEQIAMMKPKAPTEHEDGMLEFLEDIIGSNRFEEPIITLGQRVDKLNQLRTEKLNRVKIVEKEKEDLEGLKNEAVEYLKLQNEITRNKNLLCHKFIADVTESMAKATENRDEMRESCKELDEKVQEINKQFKEKDKAYKAAGKEYQGLSRACDTAKEKFQEYEKKDVSLREGIKHNKSKLKKLDKQIEQEEKKLEELAQVPEKMEKDVTELEAKVEQLKKSKEKEEAKKKEIMGTLKDQTQGLQEQKEEKERELGELKTHVNEAKSKYNVAMTEFNIYMSNLTSEQNKLKDSQFNLEETTKKLDLRKNALKEMEQKQPGLEDSMATKQKQLTHLTNTETKLQDQVRKLRMKVEECRSAQHAMNSRGKVLESLMAAKESGKIPGIYGRLGDLGAIDERYDVAISTACGALDNIVVDTMETAVVCVNFLKKNNIGSATFIGLNKQERFRRNCEQKFNAPENVPRLFDLVKVKDKAVLPAFYFALRDTLVAENLTQARRVAYGATRYRVVTLGGELIDLSGTMSGGGNKKMKGRMGTSVMEDNNPRELERVEAEFDQLTKELEQCRVERAGLEEGLQREGRTHRDLEHNLKKIRNDIESFTEHKSLLEKQIKDQQAKVKTAAPDEKKKKQMESEVDKLKEKYDKAQADAGVIEDQVYNIHKQIMEVGGSKIKPVEAKLGQIKTQMDQIQREMTKAKVNVKTAQRNTKKTEDKVKSLKEEREETDAELKQVTEEFTQLDAQAQQVMEDHKNAQESMKDMEQQMEKLKADLSGSEKEIQKLNKEGIELKHQLEKLEELVKGDEDKIRHWKKQLGKLSLHKIGVEEVEPLKTFEAEELEEVDEEKIQLEITMLEEQLAGMQPNLASIEEYRKKEEQYMDRVKELDAVTQCRDKQFHQAGELKKLRLDEFMAGFTEITNKLKEMYQMITLGGDAELELVDSLDPFTEGIMFSVRPPKKSWKSISNLSGGEKTLSSLALVFALHHYKPTPLYVMDEIDAALDFKNVSIVANYIKERTRNAQFIIISLRNNMFELADRLIGIYKTYDCTKSVAINPNKFEPVLEKALSCTMDKTLVAGENSR